jgi:hypothetical protein
MMLKIDDLTNGLRPLKVTDSADASTTRDPNLRNIMVDDPVTGRRPAVTPSDLWNYGGPHQNKSVDDLMFGRHPIGREEARTILAVLGGADFTPLSDYSNCWQDSAGTTPCTADTQVGKIASTVGSFVATQATAGFKPFLRDKFSYAPVVSAIGETWTFTGTPIAGRAGLQKQADGSLALRCINTAGNYASTPDSAATSLTGDQTHIVQLSLDNWTPAATVYFAGKYGADGQRAFYGQVAPSGKVGIVLYPTGGLDAAKILFSSSVSPTVTDGGKLALKIVCDLSDGTNSVVTFSTCTDFNTDTRAGTWTQLGTPVTSTIISAVHDSTAVLCVGAAASTLTMPGKIYYYAAYANLTGEGTPNYEFYPQRDSVNFPMNPFLDYDGSDDRLETNIAPGSYDAGYLCGGWTQMEALLSTNGFVGSSSTSTVRGFRSGITATGLVFIGRHSGSAIDTKFTSGAITQFTPFVASASYSPTQETVQLNSGSATSSAVSVDYRGSSQNMLLGACPNTENVTPVTATDFMQGYQFSQIWLPSIPTAEQKAILRAYCASKAGVTL